jgi:hypothetical protein
MDFFGLILFGIHSVSWICRFMPVFFLPNSGSFQPLFVKICFQSLSFTPLFLELQ